MSPRRRAALLLAVPVTAAVALLSLPLLGLLARTPWSRLPALLGTSEVGDALALSIGCATLGALIAGALGLPLAAWLAGGCSRIRSVVRVLVLLPMVLPPVVAGVALLLAWGRGGLVGAPLERWTGVTLPFTTGGVVVAAAYVALPFFVLAAEAGLRSFDRRYAGAAATLGAGPWRTFRVVTLPMIAPSLQAGLVVAWARALGEFGATITFAGNLAGETRTLPLAVFAALESDPDAAIALSLLLVVVSASLLFLLRGRWLPQRVEEGR